VILVQTHLQDCRRWRLQPLYAECRTGNAGCDDGAIFLKGTNIPPTRCTRRHCRPGTFDACAGDMLEVVRLQLGHAL